MEECHCYKGSVRLFSVAVAVWYQASSPTIRPLIPLPMASHSVLKISTWVLNINPEKGEKVKRRKESPKKEIEENPKRSHSRFSSCMSAFYYCLSRERI